MPRCVVIADDLTGANATGVLLTKSNFKAYTVMNYERLELKHMSSTDCIVFPTDSRSVSCETAYNRVFNATNMLANSDVIVYSKRIDSTLRGNLGAETDAMLDSLNNGSIAIAVPCFPQANRIMIGGYVLVNSMPLHKTAVAVDPKNPVNTSVAQELFEQQSKYPVRSVYMNDLSLGIDHLVKKIETLIKEGARTILFDALSEEDMDIIADAVIESCIRFIAVDPGAFTATISRKLITPLETQHAQKILVVVGSVNAVTKTQVDELLLSQRINNVYIDTKEILESDDRRNAEIIRVVNEILGNCESYDVCSIVGCGIIPEMRTPFAPYVVKHNLTEDELSMIINNAIAEMTYRILKGNTNFRGLYTSGGDITVAICKKFDTCGLKLLNEVVPLAAYGELIDGEFDGLKVITKGGMAGDKNAITACVHYLKEQLGI